MYTDYLTELKESAFKAVLTLTKKTYLFQLLAYVILFVVMILVGLLVAGSFFTEFIKMSQNPTLLMENPDFMSNLMMSNIGSMTLLVPLSLLLMSWYATFCLCINDNLVRTEQANIGLAFKKSLTSKTLHMLLYFVLIFAISIVSFLLIGLISSIGGGGAFTVVLGVIGFIAFALVAIRTIAGLGLIVHGNNNALDALTNSFKNISWMRAVIILVLGIAIYILILLIMFGISGFIASGANNMDPESFGLGSLGAGFYISQLIMILIGVAIYAFYYAGISSLYFRYNEIEETSDLNEHLVAE